MPVAAASLSICQASEWQNLVPSSAQLGSNTSSSASSEPEVFHKRPSMKLDFYHFWRDFCSFAVTVFFGEWGYVPKRTIAYTDKLRCVVFLECNCKTKACNYPAIYLKDSSKLTISRTDWEMSVNQTGSLLKWNNEHHYKCHDSLSAERWPWMLRKSVVTPLISYSNSIF